ncbi:hypothetical protein [Snodgrassella gandavensis]|uniref:hypothetical protein n=1 Tax=Snodgrassella gandavensis TaxID=2946698 RepID=UPI001EF656ED|nr:hypothetical protein [Snodgrassella gandavensis]
MNTSSLNSLLDSVNLYYSQNKAEIDTKYINKMLKELENYPIISFDVFDTVLTRLFECPIDLFACVEGILIEQKIFLPNFAQKRLIAEEISRNYYAKKEFQEEITLENIYTQLLSFYPGQEKELNQAQNIELATEKSSMVAVIDNLCLIEKLKKQGKKIYFVSDTYFSKQFVQELLQHAGLADYDKLFISSDLMKTKHSGRIWEEVQKNNINNKIFHIGDNLYSDVIKPNQNDIKTYHYSRFLGERRLGAQLSPALVPFSLLQKMSSLSQKINSDENNEESEFWTNLGNTFGAVILQSFVLWLEQQITKYKIEHIFFCARDAQIIQKVWNLLEMDKKHQTTSSYLYLSRQVLRFPVFYIDIITTGKLSNFSLDLMINESVRKGESYKTFFNRIGINNSILTKTKFKSKFGNLNQNFDFEKISEIKNYIQYELTPYLVSIYQDYYTSAMAYYEQEGLFNHNKRIAIVDLGWKGTLQTALTELREHKGIKHKIYGFYYGLFNHSAPGRLYKNGIMKSAFFNMFQRPNEELLLENSINILENLHSANHQTTINFTNHSDTSLYLPVLKPDTDYTYINQFNQTINLFQQSTIQTITKWARNEHIFGIGSEWINVSVATAAILQICITPNRYEQKYLGKISHCTLNDHQTSYHLIPQKLPVEKKEVIQLLTLGGWPCGVIGHWKANKNKIKPDIYKMAIHFFKRYPELIKNYLAN